MNKRIFPPALKTGDAVALLSPASAPQHAQDVKQGQKWLESQGWCVTVGRHASKIHGYLAGTDAERAQDLAEAFLDPKIRAIFCTRGGYGCSRLLEKFDLKLALQHPKIVVGFSDLTTLHLAFQAQGLVSFWGPMPGVPGGVNAFSTKWLKRALVSPAPLAGLPIMPRLSWTIRPGQAQGPLTGGTLTLLASSLATPYEVMTRGKIVFLEDAGEEPYKADRMLTQLLAAGKLSDAAGIVLGVFTGAESRNYPASRSFSLAEVFQDRLGPLRLPVFGGLRLGHLTSQITLPYGVMARMDAGKRFLEILESGVGRV